MTDTVTIDRGLAGEIAEHLGGLGLATPGARLTPQIVTDCRRLSDRLGPVLAIADRKEAAA